MTIDTAIEQVADAIVDAWYREHGHHECDEHCDACLVGPCDLAAAAELCCPFESHDEVERWIVSYEIRERLDVAVDNALHDRCTR